MLLLREISAGHCCIPAHGFHRHELRSPRVHRELAATQIRDLGQTGDGDIPRAPGHGAGAWSGATHRLGGDGRLISHCGCPRSASDDTQRGKARFRHEVGSELPGLGGFGCADSDSAARRRGGVAYRTRGLDFATRSSGDRRAEAIRTATRWNGADALGSQLFGENTPSVERRRQPGVDSRVDCSAHQTGTNPNGSQRMGGYRGSGAGGELCQCGARLDPDRANTRNQQREPTRGRLALLLSIAHFQNAQRALPAIAAYALAAPLMMVVYAKWMRRSHQQVRHFDRS
jgi:hypothetical protein